MLKKYQYIISIFLISSLSIFCTYIVQYWTQTWRIDFTQEKIYTLSEGSKKILQEITTPINLKLFYSKTAANRGTENLRQFNVHFEYIRSLLQEYVNASKGKLNLQVIDPRPDTDDEEEANLLGLKKFPIADNENYYFGLAAKATTGQERVIEFFDPSQQANVEYLLTKTLYALMHPRKKKIAVISDTGFNSDGLSPYILQITPGVKKRPTGKSWILSDFLKDFYDVSRIEDDVEKIENIDILLVIHPENLSDKKLYAIDQYLLKGGKMMVLVDPQLISDPHPLSERSSSEIKKLMDQWGIEFNKDQFAGDLNLAALAKLEQYGPMGRVLPLLLCDQRCFEGAKDEVLVSSMKNMLFVFPGHLTVKDPAQIGVSLFPLIQTTNAANTYTAKTEDFKQPKDLTDKFVPGNKKLNLAIRFHGPLKTAFPESQEKGLKESTVDPTIVVVADVDFINDPFAFQQTALGIGVANDNAGFFINTLDYLVGNRDLMSIRSRSGVIRGFDRIDEIEKVSQAKSVNKIQEIQRNLTLAQNEMRQLTANANEQNSNIIAQAGIQKRKELVKKMAVLKKELREVKREGREKIEAIGNNLQYIDIFLLPTLLFFWGIWIFIQRRNLLRIRRYGV